VHLDRELFAAPVRDTEARATQHAAERARRAHERGAGLGDGVDHVALGHRLDEAPARDLNLGKLGHGLSWSVARAEASHRRRLTFGA
jgi:hypothetical protein